MRETGAIQKLCRGASSLIQDRPDGLNTFAYNFTLLFHVLPYRLLAVWLLAHLLLGSQLSWNLT